MPIDTTKTNDLVKRIKEEQDIEKKRQLEEELINENTGLVKDIAKSFINHGLDFDDLCQEGYLGLIKAVKNFDTEKKVKFQTYAYRVIKQNIKRAVEEQAKSISIPEHISSELNKIMEAENRLFHTLGRDPYEKEVTEAMELEIDELRSLKSYALKVTSLEEKYGEGKEHTLVEMIKSLEKNPEEEREMKEDIETLSSSLELLNEREQDIIALSFGLYGKPRLTTEEISRKYNVSKERIRQIQNSAIKKMREQIEEDKDEDRY